ncbi:hypothetical protein F4775DRAFT_229965 [Biscogniauxia sp. FL1348]|nr:hypothetical protein F4775DRAFT_229965 [Biscogniauxia sp. FL1348]
MARLPSGALALTASLSDGTTEFTPWDPVTVNPLKRPFAAFSRSVPTPPRPYCFYMPPEERRRRAENEAWVARQRALYAAAPGTRFPRDRDQQQQQGLRLRGGSNDGGEEVGVVVEKEESTPTTLLSAIAALLQFLLAAAAATIRERVARAQFLLSRTRYEFTLYRQRPDVCQAVAILRLVLLISVVLGLAVLWVLLAYRDAGDDDNNIEIVYYVLVPNYQAWSLVPPVPDPSS